MLLAIAALPLVAAADDPLAGRVPGPPVRCIDEGRVLAPDIVDARTILYRQTGARIWRTGPDRTCPALNRRARLVVRRSRDRHLCAGDLFQVVAIGSRFPSGTCRFASFTPYDR